MDFQLALIKNPQQLILKSFGENVEMSRGKIMDIDELPKLNLQGLFLPEELLQNPEFLGTLKTSTQATPLRTAEELNISVENFEAMTTDMATPYFKKVYESWILQNNLALLEEFTTVIKHLNSLWPNDRTAFFEELWAIVRRNLGTSHLTLVYNDIQKAKKEGEKNKLIKVKVHGKEKANPEVGGELEDKLMKNYEKQFHDKFEIAQYNQEKGQLVCVFTIKKSPVILMANIYGITKLQKSLLMALIDGLQEDWV